MRPSNYAPLMRHRTISLRRGAKMRRRYLQVVTQGPWGACRSSRLGMPCRRSSSSFCWRQVTKLYPNHEPDALDLKLKPL